MICKQSGLKKINKVEKNIVMRPIPTTRATFKDYCLRNLGFGVIDINGTRRTGRRQDR